MKENQLAFITNAELKLLLWYNGKGEVLKTWQTCEVIKNAHKCKSGEVKFMASDTATGRSKMFPFKNENASLVTGDYL